MLSGSRALPMDSPVVCGTWSARTPLELRAPTARVVETMLLQKNACLDNRIEAIRITHRELGVDRAELDLSGGIGLREDDSRALNRATWRGTNWLGEILTDVREELLAKERSS